jgi:NADPH-dependent 2,4-dienoyl-CoA reductase/sulfur reductase-like enzyme
MDVEFGEMALDIVNELCGEAILGQSVKKIEGQEKVERVILENGDTFDVDAVIINAGLKPNVALAKDVGLLVDEHGINVDENMRTSGKDIYAIGDCAATRCFFSGDYTSAMHTSTSLAQARLAGANLFEMKMRKGFSGSLMAFSSKLGNGAFGTTGLTEKRASELGIDYYIGKNLIMDRNAVRLKGMERVFLKMLYQKNTNVLIGAQIKGGQAVAELVNFFTTIIQQRMTREEIDSLQIDTHPLLSSAPINFPAISATANAMLDWFKKAA